MQLSDAAYETLLGNLLGIYPDRALSPGDTWSHTLKASAVAPISGTATLTLTDATTITASGTASLDLSAFAEMGTNTPDMSGPLSGSLQLDPATGWIREGSFTLTVALEGAEGMPAPEGDTTLVLSIQTQ